MKKIWLKKLIPVISLLLGMNTLSAQWTLMVKNYLLSGSNIRVYLGYQAPTESEREFLAQISFRPENESRVFFSKEARLVAQGSDTFFLDLRLPPGKYVVEADIVNQALDVYESLRLPDPIQISRAGKIQVSDIFLVAPTQLDSLFRYPLLDDGIAFGQQKLYYAMQLKASKSNNLSVRAILYEDAISGQTTEHTAYTSVHQSNVVVPVVADRPSLFVDSLDLTQYAGGEYLIQILVYEDDNFVLDKKTRFIKGGDIEQRIFSDLDNSIRMMRYMVPADQLEELLQLSDNQVKEVEFKEIWNLLYEEQASEKMEAYFERIYEANERFSQSSMAGWESDRGEIYVKYGEPKVQAVNIRGEEYLRWVYSRWSLSFLFTLRNQTYVLVE